MILVEVESGVGEKNHTPLMKRIVRIKVEMSTLVVDTAARKMIKKGRILGKNLTLLLNATAAKQNVSACGIHTFFFIFFLAFSCYASSLRIVAIQGKEKL